MIGDKKSLIVAMGCTLLVACGGGSNNGNADNSAPEIVTQNQDILADSVDNALFLQIEDNRTRLASLDISVSSSDQAILRDEDIEVSTIGGETNLLVTPQSDIVGTLTLTVSAVDGSDNEAQASFQLDVIANEVLESLVMDDLINTGEDQDPIAVNGIELVSDIDSEEWFDSLFPL